MTANNSSGHSDTGGINRRRFLAATCALGSTPLVAGCNDQEESEASAAASGETTSEEAADCSQQVVPVGDNAATKTRRTIYTDDRIRNARASIERYDWARAERDAVVSRADAFLDAYTMEEVWHLVTGQQVPRASAVDAERRIGSPTHGPDIYTEHGRYPWEINAVEEPWKVTDPMTGIRYPTNDFQSYLVSGRDDRGFFDPARADDQYLVNETQPDRGPEWGVDDGHGWVDDDGNRFTFVAYYNHFATWSSRQSRFGLSLMAELLGRAYLYTDDRTYARAAAIILDRTADEYPRMDLWPYQTEYGFANSHGGTGKGKILGSEWETRLTSRLVDAYDAIFPAIEEDEWIVEFLADKAATYNIGRKSTPDDVRRNVENGIVRRVRRGVKQAKIRGNFGTHQRSLAKSAVVLDEPEGYTDDTLDFLFRGGDLESTDCGLQLGGGDVLPRLTGVVDRDGHNDEGAPNYHQLALERTRDVADVLDGYDNYDGADLYDHVKVERMHAGQPPLLVLNRFQPSIGDSGRTGNPGVGWMDKETMVDAFDRYDDEAYAQLAYLMNGSSTEGLHGDIFDSNPEQVQTDINNVLEADGPLDLSSRTLAGFGYTALRQGSAAESTERAVWLYYGRNSGHGHQDTLNLGIAAHGLTLAPDMGYPAQTGPSPKRINWTANTISHNTVLVDGTRQEYHWVGTPRAFDETERVSVVDVEAPDVYPQTDTYRRTTAMIRIDEETSYAVDVFRVDGGDDHHFSFHGGEGAVSTTGLDTVEQSSGTYAGEDVPKPGKGENTEYNQSGDHEAWGGKRFNNGFNYLYDVERDGSPPDRFSVDWDVADTWGVLPAERDVHLRLTMLGGTDEVALASGDPPDRSDNPGSLRYLIAHRTGSDLRSTFTSVIEPYEDSRAVASVEQVPTDSDRGSASAVRVDLLSGRTDYVVSTTDPDAKYQVDETFEFSGRFAVYSQRHRSSEYAYLHDGDRLAVKGRVLVRNSNPRLTGEVVERSSGLNHHNEMTVVVAEGPDDPWEGLADEWIYVDTDGDRNGAYRIENATDAGESDRVRLFLGQQTFVNGLADPQDPSAGYEYTVEVGDQFTIPRSGSWSRDRA
jgi:hypothetical protein